MTQKIVSPKRLKLEKIVELSFEDLQYRDKFLPTISKSRGCHVTSGTRFNRGPGFRAELAWNIVCLRDIKAGA